MTSGLSRTPIVDVKAVSASAIGILMKHEHASGGFLESTRPACLIL